MNSAALPLTISEETFQRTVIDYAVRCGWRVWHQRPAQVRNGRWASAGTGHVGVPDLLLVRNGIVLVAELKRQNGVVTPGQREWLAALGDFGRLWRPADWADVVNELR